MSWEVIVSYIAKALLFPPGINLLCLIIGLIFLKSSPKVAFTLILLSTISLFILSLPKVANELIKNIEPATAVTSQFLKQFDNQEIQDTAIVVLSGGRLPKAPEYGAIDTVNSTTLQRLKYASWLAKRTDLPILLSGGSVLNEATAEAVLMNQDIMAYYATPPKWIEAKSKNTAQNALYSAEILKQYDIKQILLVTSAWHMQRATQAFEQHDLLVIQAPTAFLGHTNDELGWLQYLPSAKALNQSNLVLNEIVGSWWYQLRY